MRCVVRALGALIAVSATVPGLAIALPATPATAAVSAVSVPAAARPPLAVSITGISPQVATKGETVKVSGTLANHTGATVTGVSVQAWSSSTGFVGQSQLSGFSAGGMYPSGLTAAGSPWVTGAVRDGKTVHWAADFPADSFYGHFGAFPVRVVATSPDGRHEATASTSVTYWPSSRASQPKKLRTAWVWPLTDAPQQGACPTTLATNHLARSVADGGRLSTLLDAGTTWGMTDNLTWAIDPALVSDVSVMTSAYHTGGKGTCSHRTRQAPSAAAKSWLAKLKTSTADAPAFATPYANVDAATLTRAGLNDNLRSAYQLGQSVAGQILPQTFGSKGNGGEDTQVLKAAWPAGDQADGGVLENLARDGGVGTVILSSTSKLPTATPHYDNALAKTTTAIGTPMTVLLANAGLTSLLGTAHAATATPSAQSALTQNFLAETAMISNEATLARSLVIAPPPAWDPSPGEAQALLAAAHNAKWLDSATLSDLAGHAAKLPARPQPAEVSKGGLPASYAASLRAATASLAQFENLLYQPPAALTSSLDAALAATGSSAWHGASLAGGQQALGNLRFYLASAESKVSMVPAGKVLLAGSSGKTPVSVTNGLNALGQDWLKVRVAVKVAASTPAGSHLQLSSSAAAKVISAGVTDTIAMQVRSATIGTSAVRLQLVTRDGSPVGKAQSLSVEVTRVGRFLLTIIIGALGLLVLTSAYRLRRKRLASARNGGSDDKADAGGAG